MIAPHSAARGRSHLHTHEWRQLMARFGFHVDFWTQSGVLMRDADGNPVRFSPRPDFLSPSELAVVTRDFLACQGHVIEAQADDAKRA